MFCLKCRTHDDRTVRLTSRSSDPHVPGLDDRVPRTACRRCAHGSRHDRKICGYGEPVRVILVDRAGHTQELVWHAVLPNEFGHDRRADRAAQVLQAYEDAALPGHVGALDVGFVQLDGGLCSLRDTGEPT